MWRPDWRGTDAVSLRVVIQPDRETVAAPKLNVMAITQLFCPYGSIGIAIGYECSEARNVAVFS